MPGINKLQKNKILYFIYKKATTRDRENSVCVRGIDDNDEDGGGNCDDCDNASTKSAVSLNV